MMPIKNPLKFINLLHNKHKGQTIWIVGSDPSLDEYPDDFLDNKTVFALHLAYLKYPNTTYRYANEYDKVEWLKKHKPEFMEKFNIFAFPFYQKTKQETIDLVGKEKPYFLRLKPFLPLDIRFIENQILKARDARTVEFGGYGTCLHTCIYVAIMTGAEMINIIGCNHESRDGYEYFREADRYRIEFYTKPYAIKGKIMKKGTKAIIKGCEKFGIYINWIKSYNQAKILDYKSE